MWRRIFRVIVVVLLLWGGRSSSGVAANAGVPYRPGAVLVRFTAGAASSLDVPRRFAVQGMRVQSEIPALGIVVLETTIGQEETAAAALRRLPGVAFAELDYLVQADTGVTRTAQADQPASTPSRSTAGTAGVSRAPNDPDYGQQWALSKINAPAAWNVTTGTVTITIAIVDTGVDLRHPDLATKLWTNPGEIPANGLDDDGNGKIDDVHGWHFFHVYHDDHFDPDENAVVQDDYGHGTHVAGIAAAATNNGIGVAGVAWERRSCR